MATHTSSGGGNGAHDGPGIGQRVDQVTESAQQLWEGARGAVHDLGQSMDLRGRVERSPYGMVLAAVGVGYLLGGGLFTPLTARLVRLGMKLAALPLVKDELIGMAETAVDGFVRGAERMAEEPPPGGGAGGENV